MIDDLHLDDTGIRLIIMYLQLCTYQQVNLGFCHNYFNEDKSLKYYFHSHSNLHMILVQITQSIIHFLIF